MGRENAKDKSKPKRSSRIRPLTDDERKLWREVVKDARPIASKSVLKAEVDEAAPVPDMLVKAEAPSTPRKPAPIAPVIKPAPYVPPSPPPLTGLEKRISQRLARGQMEIEARLDLHGHSQMQAYDALRGFISRARASGLRCVLVITGKGASPYARHTLHGATFYEVPERQGVLRSAVPRWLNEADFRAHVSGFQPAHPKHGGGGAFYIWLRKKR